MIDLNATRRAASSTGAQATAEVVICGSYRREPEVLLADFHSFRKAGCQVLSPLSATFTKIVDGFAYAQGEEDQEPHSIELRHLTAIQRADLVWFHSPKGYVGPSGAMELGFANAMGVPVFSRTLPDDPTLRDFVSLVTSPADAIAGLPRPLRNPPARSLVALQRYYAKVASERGYSDEDVRDCLILLVEEVGELAHAVRKSLGLKRHAAYDNTSVAQEMADLQLYLLHMANIMNIDLATAVERKEEENANRFVAHGHQLESQSA